MIKSSSDREIYSAIEKCLEIDESGNKSRNK